MLYHRPPEELIFLTAKEHKVLHMKGKEGYWKGKPGPNKGRIFQKKQKEKYLKSVDYIGKIKSDSSYIFSNYTKYITIENGYCPIGCWDPQSSSQGDSG